MNRQQKFTREGKTTVTVTYHRERKVADKVFDEARRRKMDAVRSVSYYCDPKTGKRGRLHVVTVRPPSEWQRYEQQHSGFGVK
jgi:hypothetical protein